MGRLGSVAAMFGALHDNETFTVPPPLCEP
jgi:hypothetical protein